MNGVLVINKSRDITSFKVIEKLRSHLKVQKMGHAGTLDPLATGVLVVCLGSATKLVDQFMNQEKEYVGAIKLGEETTTDDREGKIISAITLPSGLSKEVIEKAAFSFVGEILQRPPYFSAVKKNGRRLYEYARAGQYIDVPARPVIITKFDITEIKLPFIKFAIVCSKGTYVRAIARDMGKMLGVGGHLYDLERTRSGKFHISSAHYLSSILQESPEKAPLHML
ncbi:MAG: tRNA pseudouridine(55) synthase TruB [Deltaproteobacteria bacterium]|nr:tRNA pseudouridine(55) synthase TruB [Deltaproteobacteria bacterium]